MSGAGRRGGPEARAGRRARPEVRAGLLIPAVLALLGPAPGAGQTPDLSGYFLNVPTLSEPSLFSQGGLTDNQVLRGMLNGSWSALRFDVAYQQSVAVWENDPLGGALLLGRLSGSTDWLGLQGTIADGDHYRWSHRVDRLSLSLPLGEKGELVVGRQVVSWATTLFLTPADPFAPFDPADPFRQYRIGVDALRVTAFPGPFSEIDLVVRPARVDGEGTTLTALIRGRHSLGGWDVSGWAGWVHDDPGMALATSGSVGDWALRSEGSLRRGRDGTGVSPRISVGVDRRFTVLRRDLYVLAEYQHDGWGASDPEELLEVATGKPFGRGEMQVLGSDDGVLNGSYQLHPLWSMEALIMLGLRDGSGILSPGVTWSVAADWTLRAGAYLSWGDRGSAADPLRSEFGSTPATGYLSLMGFF